MEKNNELKQMVKEKYGAVAAGGGSCCGPGSGCGCGTASAGVNFSEPYAGLDGYVAEADLGLGCGLPTEFAGIEKGQTVLDLGSGAGNDVFVARSLVGSNGRVIGVDMVPRMLELAKANAARMGVENVEFLEGEIENLPLDDEVVDVAVSNCVLNLVPDKRKAFIEIFRVLKPGGHFCISDIVLEGELPAELEEAAALYAGCVSGAMQRKDYLDTIAQAGFQDVAVRSQRQLDLPDETLGEHLGEEAIRTFRSSEVGIFSVTVMGWRR
ncbi:MAG: arsenite methyltransferase [Gemmatimonadales bacterium]|nr:arsenite methyltransferase [Gemmatimonadales bacterium]